MFSGTAQVSHQVCHFFCQFRVSCACDWWWIKTRLSFASHIGAIMLSENKKRKRKMWSKKWYLKRNISRDAHLLNEVQEKNVP
jgi:hypothetical protein